MQKTFSGQVGLWSLLSNDVLESTQGFQYEPVLCYSVCANGTFPAVDITRIRIASRSAERQSQKRFSTSGGCPNE